MHSPTPEAPSFRISKADSPRAESPAPKSQAVSTQPGPISVIARSRPRGLGRVEGGPPGAQCLPAPFVIDIGGQQTVLATYPLLSDAVRLPGLQCDILIGSGIGEARDQPEAGFTHSWPVAVDEGELPNRRIHRALMHDPLHVFEDRAALLLIELGGLLTEQLVEIRITAIRVGPALDRQSFQAGRRIAEGAAAALDQMLVLFLRIAFEESGAFERLQACADPDLAQIVDDGLAEIGIGGVAIKFTGLKAVGITRFRQ